MVRKRVEHLFERIKNLNLKLSDIKIVAASKTKPPYMIEEAYKAGIKCFGENYLQEAKDKIQVLDVLDIEWHFIGHLQKNKVAKVVELFDVIQTVDSIALSEEINKRAGIVKKQIECFVQVNISAEESKSGIPAEQLSHFLAATKHMDNIIISGLMCIPVSYESDSQRCKEQFLLMKQLFDRYKKLYPTIRWLSMGMSSDFEVALKCGANLIRVGTTIFGKRE